jgi:hypothetical protein
VNGGRSEEEKPKRKSGETITKEKRKKERRKGEKKVKNTKAREEK